MLLDDAGQEVARAPKVWWRWTWSMSKSAHLYCVLASSPAVCPLPGLFRCAPCPPTGSYYRDLEVSDIESVNEGYASYTVTGRVKNIGPKKPYRVQVVLTAYDCWAVSWVTRKIEPDYNVVPRRRDDLHRCWRPPAVLSSGSWPRRGRRISAAQP